MLSTTGVSSNAETNDPWEIVHITIEVWVQPDHQFGGILPLHL